MHRNGKRAAMHHLDGDLLLELGVGALREKHLTHATGTQGAEDAVGPDALSFHAQSMLPRASLRQTLREVATRGGDRV